MIKQINEIIKNTPIAYDFHGKHTLATKFEEISPSNMHLYLDFDTNIGKNTCEQACDHCWFSNYEKVSKKSFDFKEGKIITDSLSALGYTVFPRYADSFGYKGEFMKEYGPANSREFREGADHKQTETMLDGDAWTSGKPLLDDNYVELLDLAYKSGYRTISITFHGTIDDDLNIIDHKSYPIKGVFKGENCLKVIKRIYDYNNMDNECKFRINIGITIGTHNNEQSSIIKYALFFNKLGVNTVRFNNFVNHSNKHEHLELSKDKTIKVYKSVKWLHENIHLNFQLGISEDFGTFGVEVMNFPDEVGICKAGHQLFTVIPSDKKMLESCADVTIEKIGDIVGCVNIFEPHFGSLIKNTNNNSKVSTYSLDFNAKAINDFNEQRLLGKYENGCYVKELRKEMQEK